MNQLIRIPGKVFKGRTAREAVANAAVYLFIFLFLYTGSSKLMDIEAFARVLSRSILLEDIASPVAYGIPLTEIGVAVALIIPRLRQAGLYLSLLLMVAFTGYLVYMVLFSSEKTCSCGGVISSLSWEQHIWFNLAFVALAATGIRMKKH